MKNKIIIIIFLIVIFLMSVGYASFATELKVYGVAEIKGTWDVEITNIKILSSKGTSTSEPPQFENTSAIFYPLLNKPGDTIIYEITITNKGSIDAVLSSADFEIDENGSPAILVETTSPSQELKAKDSTSFTVTITYDENVTEEPAVKTQLITGNITYVQK